MGGFDLGNIWDSINGGQKTFGYGQGGLSGYGSQAEVKTAYDKLGGSTPFDASKLTSDTSKGLFGGEGFGDAMDGFSNMYGIYDGIWGSGADKRDMMQEGLAAMKDNRRLAQQTMQNNMTSYDNNLSRQMNGRASMTKGLAAGSYAPDQRQKLGQYDNKQKLA